MKGIEKFLIGLLLSISFIAFVSLSGAVAKSSSSFLAGDALAACTPVVPCSTLGCGNADSCGNFCGTCESTTATPTSPTPATATPAAPKADSSILILTGISDIFHNVGGALGTLVQNIIGFIMETFITIFAGNGVKAPSGSAYLSPPRSLDEVYARYGALGALGSGVQAMYDHPPVTTADYLANIHPIVPALAESSTVSGPSILGHDPIYTYWSISRNMAYTFFVIILVVIGLMIMFRSKIDPRTTVSVTAALPNLVISLVLITFSLALAGFIIDLGRVLMELAKSVASGALSGKVPLPGVDTSYNSNLLSPWGIWQVFVITREVPSFGGIGGAIAGVFVYLIILVFSFIIGIQIFLMLLSRYVNLLIKPIFAPFVFLFAALPGRGESIGSWFKGYFIDAATFALVFLVLLLAESLRNSSTIATLGSDPFGLFLKDSNINVLVSIYVMFLATKIPAVLEEALDVKPSGHVEKSGSQPGSMMKSVPVLKNFIK